MFILFRNELFLFHFFHGSIKLFANECFSDDFVETIRTILYQPFGSDSILQTKHWTFQKSMVDILLWKPQKNYQYEKYYGFFQAFRTSFRLIFFKNIRILLKILNKIQGFSKNTSSLSAMKKFIQKKVRWYFIKFIKCKRNSF